MAALTITSRHHQRDSVSPQSALSDHVYIVLIYTHFHMMELTYIKTAMEEC